MESTAGKQHVAAVEAYTRQCMRSRAGATCDDNAGSRGRIASGGRGPARACRSDEQFTASEMMKSRESRPNNLVRSGSELMQRKLQSCGCVLTNYFNLL